MNLNNDEKELLIAVIELHYKGYNKPLMIENILQKLQS